MRTPDFSRIRLDAMIDLCHPLAALARELPWYRIEQDFAAKFTHKLVRIGKRSPTTSWSNTGWGPGPGEQRGLPLSDDHFCLRMPCSALACCKTMKTYSPLLEREAECRLVRTISPDDIRSPTSATSVMTPSMSWREVDAIRLLECQETVCCSSRRLPVQDMKGCIGNSRLLMELQGEEVGARRRSGIRTGGNQGIGMSGAGRAAFLSRAMSERGATVTGLEFNDSAAELGGAVASKSSRR